MVPLYLPTAAVSGLLCGVEHCPFVWDPYGIDISDTQMTNQTKRWKWVSLGTCLSEAQNDPSEFLESIDKWEGQVSS